MLRFGIVGAGARGHLFAEAISRSSLAKVAGVSDPFRSPEWAKKFGTYSTHEELFESVSLDAVVVATPDFAHCEPAVAAANIGLPVFVEKPLATSREDGLAMVGAANRNNTPLIVGFENRWNPHVARIHDSVRNGELGRIVWQQAELSNTQYVPREMLSWSGQSSPIWFLMPHTVDLVTWMAGDSVKNVTASASRGILDAQGINSWDAVQALLTFSGGGSATLTSSWVLPESTPSVVAFTYDINGEVGAARADMVDQGLTVLGKRPRLQGPFDGPIGGQVAGAPVWMIDDFISSVASGEFVGPSAAEGMAVTEILLAIEESITTGSPVVP